MYAISAIINRTGVHATPADPKGWESSRVVPTFYLDERTQGITSAEQAVRIARDIVLPLGETPDMTAAITAVRVPGDDAAPDPDARPETACGCGFSIVYTGDGWQHDAAPWFWGEDHDADPGPDAIAAAEAWDAAHPDEDDADEDGDHEDGDGCAIYFPSHQVNRNGDMSDTVDVSDLEIGDTYHDPETDPDGKWWPVSDVCVDGDDVHIESNDDNG